MPHHPALAAADIAAIAQWLWPGLARLDSKGVTLVRRFGQPKPIPFAPHQNLEDVWLVLAELHKRRLLPQFFTEMEVHLGKFGFLQDGSRRQVRGGAGKGATDLESSILPQKFPANLSFRERVDLIQGFLGEGAGPNHLSNIERKACAVEAAGILPRAVAPSEEDPVLPYALTACVTLECRRHWLRRFLHQLSMLDYPWFKAISFKHVFCLKKPLLAVATNETPESFAAKLRHNEEELQRKLLWEDGISWAGHGLDFHPNEATYRWHEERWRALSLDADPFVYLGPWLRHHGLQRRSLGLAKRYFQALPIYQRRVVVLHTVRRWSFLRIEDRLDLPALSANAEWKIAKDQIHEFMRLWKQKTGILASCTQALINLMHQSRREARERQRD